MEEVFQHHMSEAGIINESSLEIFNLTDDGLDQEGEGVNKVKSLRMYLNFYTRMTFVHFRPTLPSRPPL